LFIAAAAATAIAGIVYVLHLDYVRKEITQLYIKGRISDAHYNVLDKIICEYVAKADNK
jgi:hypothetical protein